MKKTITLLILLSIFLLQGCLLQKTSSEPLTPVVTPAIQSQRPLWIDNPRLAGDIVGLGFAARHINGRQAQRELATRRAVDEIATQLGVHVSNISLMQQQSTHIRSSTRMDTQSQHTVDNQLVRAVIHDEWYEDGNLYIIMVAE